MQRRAERAGPNADNPALLSAPGHLPALLGLEISARAFARPCVGVHRRRFEVGVPERHRYQGDWCAVVDRVRRVRMAQSMHGRGRIDAGTLGGVFHDVVHRPLR